VILGAGLDSFAYRRLDVAKDLRGATTIGIYRAARDSARKSFAARAGVRSCIQSLKLTLIRRFAPNICLTLSVWSIRLDGTG